MLPVGQTRQEYEGDSGRHRVLTQRRQCLVAVEYRHLDVADDHVRQVLLGHFNPGDPVVRCQRLKSTRSQGLRCQRHHGGIIIND